MRLPVIATLTLATILSVGIAAPAYAADPVSYIDYSLDAGDPQYSGGSIADFGGACNFVDDAALRHYTVQPFHVDVAGVYTPVDRAWTPTGGLLGDGTLAIYTAAPDVSSLGTSCLLGVDDGVYRTVTLDANTTYFLFQSSSAPGAVGSFGFDVTGPGSLALGAFVPAATSTTLSADPVSAVVGAPIDLTATVTGSDPTGTVEFFADGSTLGTAATASGIATFSVSTLAVGSHSITANYSGDATNAASTSAAVTVTVTAAPVIPGPTTTTLSTSTLSAEAGTAIALTASVTGSAPTGDVEFFAGGSSLGTAATASGIATFSVSTLAVGSHAITASYSGDATNAASTSAAVTVTVTAAPVIPGPTTTTLSTSTLSADAGTAIGLTATVTGTDPTGSVEFFADGSSLGTAPTSSGIAAFSASTLAVGSHAITASYSGDATNAASASTAVTVTVTAAPVIPGATTTTLSTSAASAEAGTAIALTATVTGSDPTGTVEFFADGSSLGTAATVKGVATLSVSTLAVGSHAITARYLGDEKNAPSSAPAITITVTAAALPSVPPTTAPAAALPATGSNPLPAGLAALLLLAFGGAMLLTRVRRTGVAA
ncbi:Ig-like domain-containing protein [Leifsonia sp. Root4]|uniref:Ig-like domain-containing protein n=1 Tax=Leifsonia sp. Root4 TaxID=1736525 RepID=UPI00138ED207|nr:Ig-like domain-containing protein [Leifsonia sp. Root4]